MIFYIISTIVSVLISASTLYFTNLYSIWYYDLLFIILIPIFNALIFGLYLAVLWIIQLFMNNKKEIKKPNRFLLFCLDQTSKWASILLFVVVKKTNLDLFPDEPCLIVTNHQSGWDPILTLATYNKKPLVCVSKPSNMNFPIAGKYMYKAGFIPIDRENNFNAAKSISKAINFITKENVSIYIAPEGTRNKLSDELLEFHAGSFKIAYKAKVPIVIVSLNNTKKISFNVFKPSVVNFDVLKVLKYEEYSSMNTNQIAEYSRKLIQEKLNSYKR